MSGRIPTSPVAPHMHERDISPRRSGAQVAEPDELTAAIQFIPAQIYPAGSDIFRQGESVRDVHFVGRGLVKLQHVCPDGREAIVGLRSAGWILGAAESVLGQPYTVAARTVTTCEIRRMGIAAFRQLVRQEHGFSWLLHVIHSREIVSQLEQVAAFNCLSAHERLRAFLRQIVEVLPVESPLPVQVPLRDWEIAQLVGVTPQYLSRLMHTMKSEGLLSRRNHRWLVT